MIQKRCSDRIFAFLAIVAVSWFYATALQAHSVSRPLAFKTYFPAPVSMVHDGSGNPGEVITAKLYKNVGGTWVLITSDTTVTQGTYWFFNIYSIGAGHWLLETLGSGAPVLTEFFVQ